MGETFTKVFCKYANFTDVFLSKFVVKLPKYTKINNHIIELMDDWQPLYNFIYSLRLVKLEILKTYIENNLTNDYIKSSKYPTRVSIFFNKKPDRSLRLCINYQGFNSLIIKN